MNQKITKNNGKYTFRPATKVMISTFRGSHRNKRRFALMPSYCSKRTRIPHPQKSFSWQTLTLNQTNTAKVSSDTTSAIRIYSLSHQVHPYIHSFIQNPMVCTPHEHVPPTRSHVAGDYLPTSTAIFWPVSSRSGFSSFFPGHFFISVVLIPQGPYHVFLCSVTPPRHDVSNIFPGSLPQVSSSLVWNLLLLLTTHSGALELCGRPQLDP